MGSKTTATINSPSKYSHLKIALKFRVNKICVPNASTGTINATGPLVSIPKPIPAKPKIICTIFLFWSHAASCQMLNITQLIKTVSVFTSWFIR